MRPDNDHLNNIIIVMFKEIYEITNQENFTKKNEIPIQISIQTRPVPE